MIGKIGQLLVVLGLFSLALAGLFLAIGHDPDAFVTNNQAETMANFAYALFVAGLIIQIIKPPKK